MFVGMEKPIETTGKYVTLILAIAIFVFLDLGVLILNYHLSTKFQEDAVGINLAGRQRMLSQKITKSLAVALQEHNTSPNNNDLVKVSNNAYIEAHDAATLFGKTLDAFALGGVTLGADQNSVTLSPLSETLHSKFMIRALEIWAPFQLMLSSRNGVDRDTLLNQSKYMVQYNLELLSLMNGITLGLEQEAAARAKTLRTIQTIAMVLVIANFAFILVHFIRQLRERDQAIQTYANGLLRNLESVKRQVKEEKAHILSQLDKKHALVDEREVARRRRAVATAFGQYLDGHQLMQALWLWKEDGSNRLPRISLFPFVKTVVRHLNIVEKKEFIYMELARCYAADESDLDPDPLPKMLQWQLEENGSSIINVDTSTPLMRVMSYIHALDSTKSIELRRHLLSLEAQLRLSEIDKKALRKWLLGSEAAQVPTIDQPTVSHIIQAVQNWCKANFSPLVSQQIQRLVAE